jgi:hypothetical protein
LVKTVRTSCRTIELFEIARTVLAKPDRFTVSVSPRQPESAAEPGPERADSPPASAAAKPAAIHICVPDGQPFDSEEAAIAHGLKNHMALFFDTKEVEADPPKGNFQVVNRCGITGELLGPPNYHRYAQTMQRHFESRIGRMSLEEYRTRIESVRDPLVVQQWVDKMRKVTRYFWKLPPEGGTPVPARIDEPKAAPDVTPTAEAAPAEPAPATSEGAASAAPEAAPGVESEATPASGNETAAEAASPGALSFDSLEDARNYLLAQARGRLVRPIGTVRIHGRTLDALPAGEIRRAIEGEYERQSRFPLDTANALRGRLRREHFTIFKKGAKGVSYVCAVKRKFRVPGQTFSESIGGLISFVETHAMIKAGELPAQYLGLPAPAAPVEGAAPTQDLTPEQRDRKRRVEADILWLVREGYVTEFIDGSLYASPPVAEARRTEVEAGEADPENFPEVPEAPGAVDEAPPEAAPASIPAQDVAVEQPAPETSPQAGDPAPPAA